MKIIRNRPGRVEATGRKQSAVTIGNFDGVHLGHQALIQRCIELADTDLQVSAVTFEPLPQALFRPEDAPARLSTVHQKLAQFRAAGVDLVWMLRFDRQLAALSAADFARQVLSEGLAARFVVVGEDFRFGHRREGDINRLADLGKELGFSVKPVSAVTGSGGRISSTAIRVALAAGEFGLARHMLGRPFRMEGYVVTGQQLGRKLGYPTANLRIRARPAAVEGVFAVWARAYPNGSGPGGLEGWLPGVASLGWRPVVAGDEPLLEVHLFDFQGDLYGQHLEVEFVAKLRQEQHFETIDGLVAQMRHDESDARQILDNTRQPA